MSVSHLGVIMLIALVSSALVATGLPAQVSHRVETAVCQVTDKACEPARTTAPIGEGTAGSIEPGTILNLTASRAPAAPIAINHPDATAPKDDNGYDGGYWSCGWFGKTACDMAQGFGRGTADVVTGAAQSTCLAHLCSHSGFKNSWKGTFDGVKGLVTDPADSLKSMWNDSTKDIRKDWNNDHKASAITRVIPTIIGGILGGKSLKTLRKPGDKRKTADAIPDTDVIASANKAAEAARAAEEATERDDIKAADAALKQAEKHTRAAEKAARWSRDKKDKDAATAARERVDRARNALTDTKIRKIMVKSSRGRQAQKVLDTHRPTVNYTPNGGSFYSPSRNAIQISMLRATPAYQAVILIHEATHLEFNKTGRAARTNKVSRSDYVDGKMKEEAEAKVRQIEAGIELRKLGENVTWNTNFEPTYKKAYNRAVKAAAKKNKDLSEHEKSEIGGRAAATAILDLYRSGRIRTGSPGNPRYPDYYGSFWDEVHGTDP